MDIKNIEDCFRLGILRKIKPDVLKSNKSMELAQKQNIGIKFVEHAIKKAF